MLRRIPLSIPSVGDAEAKNLLHCIETNFVSSVGPFVSSFEERVVQTAGAHRGISTSSGTTALHLALVTLGIKPGSLVIVPTYTFVATANAVSQCGAMPWFMDISEDSWTLCPESLKDSLDRETIRKDSKIIHKESGREVSAILAVYTLGSIPQMDEINEVAREYKLPVIADAACALGATYKDRQIGELAPLSTFSFNGNKTITTGAGGMLVGNDSTLLDRARHLATTGRVGTEYDHDVPAFNYRMSNIQAAVGCAQLDKLSDFLQAKARIRSRYDEALAHLDVELFPNPQWCKNTYWFSGVVLKNNDVAMVCQKLKEVGIEARGFWKPMHLQKAYSESPTSLTGIADKLWSRVLTLPCSTSLNVEDQDYVISQLSQILESR